MTRHPESSGRARRRGAPARHFGTGRAGGGGLARALAAAALALGVCWTVPAGAGPVPADLGQRLAQGYAAPATARLAASAERLRQGLAAYCERSGPDGAAAQTLERAFGDTVLAWAGVMFLRFGPLVQDNRYERIAFWPDPRGVMQRQVQGLLSSPEAAGLDAGMLAGRSVALQGLPALEFVLYRDGGLLRQAEPQAAECRYAGALAQVLVRTVRELAQAWSGQGEFAQDFSRPGPQRNAYRSQREVAAEAVKALSGGLQFARDIQLAPTLAEPYRDSLARRAPFWRSGLTVAFLRAQAQGLLAFYDTARWGFDARNAGMDQSIRHELAQWEQVLAGLPGRPYAELLQDEAARGRLGLLLLVLQNARSLVDQDLAGYLGIAVGFNALDGD
ncbi:imelysin family protein [Orrella sp. JC864]|uniref:imelysin family protein n=1 Tax=Orrella sp. JC864 TaxID=3120298 RepID=UPI0030098201